MPELPEVETSRSGISPHIKGEILDQAIIREAKLRWPIPLKDIQRCQGKKLVDVTRRGKYIQLWFEHGYMLLHLGMSGSLRVLESAPAPDKHDHVDLVFGNGKVLRFNDPRKFGCLLFQPAGEEHALLSGLGPEPLTDEFSAEYLFKLSRGRVASVKNFIMDSHVVVGVGNIYAAESLFLAGISPKAKAGKISLKRYEKLVEQIKIVLAKAIKQGGTTLRDFTDSSGKPGYFKQELNVYGRQGEPCGVCGNPIKMIKIGQRSTFYCSRCQK